MFIVTPLQIIASVISFTSLCNSESLFTTPSPQPMMHTHHNSSTTYDAYPPPPLHNPSRTITLRLIFQPPLRHPPTRGTPNYKTTIVPTHQHEPHAISPYTPSSSPIHLHISAPSAPHSSESSSSFSSSSYSTYT